MIPYVVIVEWIVLRSHDSWWSNARRCSNLALENRIFGPTEQV